MYAQDQHAHRRVLGAQARQRLEKGPTGHRTAEQQELGRGATGRGEHLLGVPRLARDDQPRVGLHDAPQPLPYDRMVVRDEDANHEVTGIVTTIDVPSPGLPRTIKTPPHASARSRIPTRPSECSPLRESGANPTPLSATLRMMAFPARRTVTSTRVALACRVTLVSAS